jgi:pyruvate/2-oxoglutarate dehydrogenase complex dihydrolipoamide dehydrogenase (E3) component
MKPFDAIIIGAGQAGGPLSHQLADRGWKVALVEREHLGGSCINYGCTPTKTMVASARAAQMVRRAGEFGVIVDQPEVDLAAVVRRKNRVVEEWRAGQQAHIDRRPNITLFRGEASFSSPRTVIVNGETLTSEKIFINTGTRAWLPEIKGINNVPVLTNKSILEVTELPEHLLVVGGSYVGLEFGQMFRRFGCRVTVSEHSAQLVSREDEDIAASLQEALEEEGMEFLLNHEAVAIEELSPGAIRLTLRNRENGKKRELIGSHVLVGAGRIPNVEALNLPAAGVEQEARGWIKVNDYLETSVPGIFALGDVKGGPAFTHISYNDFQIVLHNLFHPEKKTINNRIVPYALYTEPELGRVGMTEKEARQRGIEIKVGSIPMAWVARAIESSQTQGLMKIVVDAKTDQILGAAILGAQGGELVQTLMGLMLAKAPWTVFHKAIFIHPTLTEGFFSLMDQVGV